MRNIAIININQDIDIHKNIISNINPTENIFVFSIFDNQPLSNCENITCISIPEEFRHSQSKIKNYVTKYFFNKNFEGYLHVIEDQVVIFNSPTNFINEIEIMMSKLGIKSWFNTITDKCNYTFNVYNPRFLIEIDDDEYKKIYDKTIFWTSHANTSWVCYNFNDSCYEDFEFDEIFKVPMFYIISFFAKRRANKKTNEMYYMNFNPTIDSEKNVFKSLEIDESISITPEEQQTEYNKFKELKFNIQADSKIEPIFDDLVENLKKCHI